MAINIPIVTEFVDQGLKSAQGAFDNFRMKVGEADGGLNKLKAGAGAAFDSIKANAGAMALGAGTAIAGFALKAIGDFQRLALEVDKFSNSSGLAAEEASRWVEVAGDVGVESNTLITAFNRLNRAAGDNSAAFADLGVEIARTASGATDVNETFLRTVDALKKVDDPAQRARLATQLLGKSWTELSELVEMGATDLTAALEEVSEAKVIDEEEIRKAKELRAAQDALNDAFQEIVLTIGEALLPALQQTTETIVPLVNALKPLVTVLGEGADANSSYAEQASKNNVQMRTGIGLVSKLAEMLGFGKDKTEELTEENYKNLASFIAGNEAVLSFTQTTEDLTTSIEEVDYALEKLKGEVDDRTAWRNLQDEFDNVVEAAVEAFTEGTPAAIRDSEQALDDLRVELAEYIVEASNIPTEVKTQFLAEIPTADLDRLNQLLDYIGRSRSVSFIPVIEQARENAGTGSGMGSGRAPRLNPTSTGNVTVNVAGSVVTEGDLVNKVRKGLIDAQRNGAPLVYSNS